MNFDFDTVNERRGTGSLKWSVGSDELPMWVADMDFKTAPEITREIRKIAERGIYGYTVIEDGWYNSYISWWQKRHGLCMKRKGLAFATGVVPIISSAVRRLSATGDNVIIQTPAYNIFFNSCFNNQRNVLENPLIYGDDGYKMDFSDLEKKLSLKETSLMILCNPQNPTGNIWSREELSEVGELCKKHGVTVISDEIHCDITAPGFDYTPFAAASETCRDISVTCIAPTKAFNIAGIQTAAFYAENEELFSKVNRGINTDEVAEPNVFAAAAAEAAFTKGEAWLEAAREYINENKSLAEAYIKENVPGITVCRSKATYLLWLDIGEISDSADELSGLIRKKTGLYLSSGAAYRGNGEHFLRMNIACPKKTLADGLSRLVKGIIK